jgi:hypothetical protein
LIPNNGLNKASAIANFYQKLLINITSQLNLHILNIGFDSALVEFQVQIMIQSMITSERLQMIDIRFKVAFSYSILPSIESIVKIQNLKHTKKICQNVIISSTRVLLLERSTAHLTIFYIFLNIWIL